MTWDGTERRKARRWRPAPCQRTGSPEYVNPNGKATDFQIGDAVTCSDSLNGHQLGVVTGRDYRRVYVRYVWAYNSHAMDPRNLLPRR